MVLETAAMWALEGFVRGLGHRLATSPSQRVKLRSIELNLDDIRSEQRRLRASQEEMQEAIAVAFKDFQTVVARNEALKV